MISGTFGAGISFFFKELVLPECSAFNNLFSANSYVMAIQLENFNQLR